jgi:NAD(P)-dependent dehydrogenase (short-subunit alcohol dehydrogenase family)
LAFSNLMLERGYEAMKAYSQSKLAQVMFTFELTEHLRGTGVTVNALHPASLMNTKMVQSTFGYSMSTVEEGTQAVVRLAVSKELEGVTGRYFDGTREARANRQAYDPRVRDRLWVLSEQLCGRLLEPVVRR